MILDEEALRQFSTLSSLLAGFGVMVTVGLFSLKDERRIVSWVIGVMILALVLFLTSTSLNLRTRALNFFPTRIGYLPDEKLKNAKQDHEAPIDPPRRWLGYSQFIIH